MKKYLSPIIKHALVSCIGFSYWVSITHASILFLVNINIPKRKIMKSNIYSAP